jgi:hypothetical protein
MSGQPTNTDESSKLTRVYPLSLRRDIAELSRRSLSGETPLIFKDDFNLLPKEEGPLVEIVPETPLKEPIGLISAGETEERSISGSGIDDAEIDAFMSNIRPLDLMVFKGSEAVSKLIMECEKLYLGATGKNTASHVEVAMTRKWCWKIKDFRKFSKEDRASHLPNGSLEGGPLPEGRGQDREAKNPIRTRIRKARPGVSEGVSPVGSANELMSWGSTLSGKLNDGVNDAETGGVTFGVQFRQLRELIKKYSAKEGSNVGVCRLKVNPTETQDPKEIQDLQNKIAAAYDKYNHAHYDFNPMNLLGALFPKLRLIQKFEDHFKPSDTFYFCSEFAARLYEDLGIIPETVVTADVVPADFLGNDADVDGVNNICKKPIWLKK